MTQNREAKPELCYQEGGAQQELSGFGVSADREADGGVCVFEKGK